MTKTKTTPNKPLDQAANAYASAVEQAMRANRVLASGVERTIQEQVDLMEATVEHWQPLAGVEKPADLVKAQVEAIKSIQERVVATASNVLKIQQETGAELRDVMLEGVKAATTIHSNAA